MLGLETRSPVSGLELRSPVSSLEPRSPVSGLQTALLSHELKLPLPSATSFSPDGTGEEEGAEEEEADSGEAEG